MGKKPSLLEHIHQKTSNPIETEEHARALIPHVLQLCGLPEFDDEAIDATSDLLDAMQRVVNIDAAQVLRQAALPALIALYDRIRERAIEDDPWASQILFFLKIFALYGGSAATTRIIDAARAGIQSDSVVWSAIFGELSDSPSEARQVLDALARPLPEAFISVALLDLANTIWRTAPDSSHAFDTEAGRTLLADFLASRDVHNFSHAHSACAALAGITGLAAAELLAQADVHPDLYVRMEAAWVRSRNGDEVATGRLSQWAADPRTGRRALEYLRELGRLDAIPRTVNSLDYFALSEMSAWLAHPLEFGHPPDEVSLLDHRRIFWPPTNDERDMWLVRYRYTEGENDHGVGCVGSVTFALFGEASTELDADDLYGLYCCWELEQLDDPRAPRHRSALAGRKLLGFKKKPQ